jgi:23S rRNA (cytidine2498-2'-O)-methyltransferase
MVSIIMIMGQNKLTAYLAPKEFQRDFRQDLRSELKLRGIKILEEFDRLFLCEGEAKDVVFAQDTWHDVEILPFNSISNASELLKERNNRYSHYTIKNHRRAELISEKVPMAKNKLYNFLEEVPTKSIGCFSLLSEKEMLVSRRTKCPLPFGEIHFVEDKITPPSRAYLKLWELFTLYGLKPDAGMKVVDMGSCPGGWTWVLQTVGCHVISVDKAPLDPKIASLPNIEFRQESAFGLRPMHIGELDWFYSDIICYPSKLLEFVNRYRESGLVKNFACTIKFQNETDFETMFKFEEIPHSKIVHLSCNKHEVTWIYNPPK